MQEPIGENTFLKLRQERDQARSECELVKIQRDIALRKLNKTLKCITELRMIIEDVAKKEVIFIQILGRDSKNTNIKCLMILDNQQVKRLVVIVVCTATEDRIVVSM